MTNLIDDETASRFWQERDTAPEAERESRNAALMEWAKAKKAEQRRTQRDEVESGYMDFEGWWGTTGADAAMFNGDEDRQEILNRRYIAHQFDQTPDEQGRFYPTYRDQFLQETFGKSGLSEAETFNLIKGAVESKKATEAAINNIPGDVALALWDNIGTGAPVNPAKVLETWKQKNADQLAGLPENWESKTLAEVGKYISETEQMLRDHAEPLKKVYDHFAAVTGRGVENAGESQPKNLEEMQALVDTLAGMPQPVRDRALASVYMAAENSGMDAKGVLQQFGESWSRTLNRVRTTALVAEEYDTTQRLKMLRDTEGLPELYKNKTDQGPKVVTGATAAFSPQDYEPLTPDERTAFAAEAEKELARFQVYRELQNIADNKFDPIQKIKGNATPDFVEAILYGTPDALATSVVAALPVIGAPLTVGTIYADEYNQLRLQGIDAENAQAIAGYSAGLQMVPEVFGAKLIFGQLPWFENLMRKYANPARFGRGAQFAMRYGAGIAGENLTEGIQDLATPVVQDIRAAFRSEVPDVDWDATWNDWWSSRPDVFAATLVPVMVGTGMASMADSDRFSSYEYRLSELYKPLGLSEKKVRVIEDGGTPQEIQSRLVEQVTNISPEEIKSGIAYQEQRLNEAKAEQEDGTKPTLVRETAPDGSQQFVVRDGSGQAVYTSKDYTAASQAFIETRREQVAADLEGERAILRDLANQWLSQDSANTLVEETRGLNAAQKLEQLQAAGNAAQIEELHNRIANSPFKDTPYDQINILGEASLQDVAEMVWRPLIKINPNTRPENLREEIHHIGVKIALKNNRVTLDTLRGWLDATEKALPGTFQNLVRETEGDIIESLAQVQAAYEDGKINANEETKLPASFVDYMKRMMRAFAEVLRRAVALRGAFKDGILPAEYEAFLAESTGLNQQTLVDTTRDRVSNEVLTDTNYSIGSKPYPMEDKGKWYANEDFAQRGGRIVTMSPDQFLSQVRPLKVDEASRDNIDDLKNMMQSGRKLDPLAIYADGKEDGRHRAIAAKELGITSIPVIDFRQPVSADTGATNYSIGIDLRQVPLGADLAQVWNKFPKSEVSLPDLPEDATPDELRKIAEQALRNQPDRVTSAFDKEVVLHDVKNIKGKAEHFVSGQYRERRPEPNRVRTLQMLAHTIRNAMAYGSAGKNRFAYIYRYSDGTVHVVIVQNAAGKEAIQRQFTITQFDHDTSKQISGIRILRKKESGPQPTATPQPSPSSAIGASEEPATSSPISEQSSDVNKNFSIASQSEIDRVNRALGGMNRGPDERLKVYERAKAKFSKLMAWNSDELAAMADTGSDDSQIRRTQILQALGELDGILSVLPAEVRGRVGGYTKLASIAPMDVFKDGVKISEVSGMNGAIISAWMREGQNIGQAGKQVSLPPGYTATENLSTKRADKAIADFFRDRIKKIDAEFEKVVAREYRNAILDLVKKSRPKAGDNNVRKSTLGAETQKLADMVQRATLMDEDAVAERMLQLEQTMATSENSADMVEEWGILNQFGDLKNRNSETLAQAYGWFKDQLQMGREAWRIKEEARIAENRERVKKTVEFIGGATAVDRFKDKTFMDRVSDWANHALLDHASFEQFVTALFPPDVAADFSTRLRKADVAAQKAEIDQREGILNALREGAKAAGTTTGKAMEMLKTEVPSAVRYLDGRKVKNTKLTIEQAEKIVRGEIDRSDLTDTDVRNISDELAALPADTRKENITLKQIVYPGKEVRLPMTRGKAIQLLLSWNQPDVQDKMRREGWNEDSIADLRELTSDPVSQAMIAHAQQLYGKGAGIVNPVYARMFGMNMPQVKNYAPTRFLHSSDVKDIGLDGSPVATGTTPGFAKSRVSHSAKIAPEDALSVMQQHILTQAHWVNFAELAREYRSLINNPEIREAIKAKHGTGVLKTAELWADQMEQRGGNQSREAAWVNAILGSVIGGQSVASLGFNLKTLAMQLDNSVRFALALDKKQIMAAMSSPDQLIEDIKTVFESDALQTRLRGGATAETRYMFERFGGKPGTSAKVTEAAMSTINWMDTATTSFSAAIVYRANLNEALEAGMPESLARETALDAAAAAIYRFAQPVSFGQKSNVENSGNIYTKAFFLFMSDPRLKTAIIADAVRGLATGRGDKGTHIRRLVAVELMAVLSHVVASAYRDAFTGDDDEEIWGLGGFVRALALAPLQGFFFAGTMFDSVLSQLTGAGFFTPTQNPLLTVSQTGIRALKNADDILAFDDPDALLKEWSAIARTMAVAPAAAMPAVLLNAIKPIFGAAQNTETEE